MKKIRASERHIRDEISATRLKEGIASWLRAAKFSRCSEPTIEKYDVISRNLVWFLRDTDVEVCGREEIIRFFEYLTVGHEDLRGRWANPQNRRQASAGTAHTYFQAIRTLFRFMVSNGFLGSSPVETIRPPINRADQVSPFSTDDLGGLLGAAKNSRHPNRDTAILLMLLTTGMRASELCTLKVKDLDLDDNRCVVLGKGNKTRTAYFSNEAAEAIWRYLSEPAAERRPTDPVFTSGSRQRCRAWSDEVWLAAIVRSTRKLEADIQVRCSPHTMRHTFAVRYLQMGGSPLDPAGTTWPYLSGHDEAVCVNRRARTPGSASTH